MIINTVLIISWRNFQQNEIIDMTLKILNRRKFHQLFWVMLKYRTHQSGHQKSDVLLINVQIDMLTIV